MRDQLRGRGTIDSSQKTLRLLDALDGQLGTMRGNVPEKVRNDPRFRMLFQQWKLAGGKKDSPYVALMRSRWAYLTQEQTHGNGSTEPPN